MQRVVLRLGTTALKGDQPSINALLDVAKTISHDLALLQAEVSAEPVSPTNKPLGLTVPGPPMMALPSPLLRPTRPRHDQEASLLDLTHSEELLPTARYSIDVEQLELRFSDGRSMLGMVMSVESRHDSRNDCLDGVVSFGQVHVFLRGGLTTPVSLLRCKQAQCTYQTRKSRTHFTFGRENTGPLLCHCDMESVLGCAFMVQFIQSMLLAQGSLSKQSPRHHQEVSLRSECTVEVNLDDLQVFYVTGWPSAPMARLLLKSGGKGPVTYRSHIGSHHSAHMPDDSQKDTCKFQANFDVNVDILNGTLACWEPLVEPWVVHVEQKFHRSNHVSFRAERLLQLNITPMYAGLFHATRKRYSSCTDTVPQTAPGHSQPPSIVPEADSPSTMEGPPELKCRIRNEARHELFFTDVDGKDERMLSARQSSDLLGVITSDATHYRQHRIGLRIEGWKLTWVQIEKTGVLPVLLIPTPDSPLPEATLICEIFVSPQGKLVVVKSPVEMRNSSDRGLDIKFGRRMVGALNPGERMPLELLVTAGTLGDGELQIRPSRSSVSQGGHFFAWSRRAEGLKLVGMQTATTHSLELTCVGE